MSQYSRRSIELNRWATAPGIRNTLVELEPLGKDDLDAQALLNEEGRFENPMAKWSSRVEILTFKRSCGRVGWPSPARVRWAFFAPTPARRTMSKSSFWRLLRLALLLSRDPYVENSEHVRAARPSTSAVRDQDARLLRRGHELHGSVKRIAAPWGKVQA